MNEFNLVMRPKYRNEVKAVRVVLQGLVDGKGPWLMRISKSLALHIPEERGP